MSIVTRLAKSGNSVLCSKDDPGTNASTNVCHSLGEAKVRDAQLDVLASNAAEVTISRKQWVEVLTCVEKPATASLP